MMRKFQEGQSDTANYEQAIDNCGQRDDTDISLGIEMNHLGSRPIRSKCENDVE